MFIFVSTYAVSAHTNQIWRSYACSKASCISGFLRLSATVLSVIWGWSCRVALAPFGLPRRVVAPSRHPAPRSRQARSRPAEQGRHRARLGARRRVISICEGITDRAPLSYQSEIGFLENTACSKPTIHRELLSHMLSHQTALAKICRIAAV